MKKCMMIILLLAGTSIFAQGDMDKKLALADEIMELTASKDMFNQMVNNMMNMFASEFSQSAEDQAVFKEIAEEMNASSQEMIKKIAEVYAETFTVEELQGMVDFFNTPTGRAFVEHQPEIMQKSMEIGRAWGEDMAAKVMERKQP